MEDRQKKRETHMHSRGRHLSAEKREYRYTTIESYNFLPPYSIHVRFLSLGLTHVLNDGCISYIFELNAIIYHWNELILKKYMKEEN